MSESLLLLLVFRYPHATALARRAPSAALFPGLRSLERRGFVRRHRDRYRLTGRGRDELATACAVTRLVLRTA